MPGEVAWRHDHVTRGIKTPMMGRELVVSKVPVTPISGKSPIEQNPFVPVGSASDASNGVGNGGEPIAQCGQDVSSLTRGRKKHKDHAISAQPVASKIIQFEWGRRWKTDVEPYLDLPLVRTSVEIGMLVYDVNWTWDDGPHAIGRGQWNGQRVVPGKLSWYQPWGRCHWISFFACAIGVMNYPELDWRFINGPCHTVVVGSRGGKDHVVMDILFFKRMTAAESIARAQYVPPRIPKVDPDVDAIWKMVFSSYIECLVPELREIAHAGDRSAGNGSATNHKACKSDNALRRNKNVRSENR